MKLYRFNRSTYGTYIVWAYEPRIGNQGRTTLRRTERMYETTNQTKAWGVTEYLNRKA
jgi:hypothetical protein